MSSDHTLITFAVKEEAAPFLERTRGFARLKVVVTGMGQVNARRAIEHALDSERPSRVFTCGFAGGLNPACEPVSVVFDLDDPLKALEPKLASLEARPGRFLCLDKVVCEASAKAKAFQETGCDAVEMESGVIREVCRTRGIPSGTIRVISDAADEPLPLDFGALMTPDYKMDFLKLAGALARSPGRIPALMQFRKRILASADKLAGVLSGITH